MPRRLFLFVAVATGATIRRAITRIAYVNFAERTVITRTVILTFRNATADTRVYFLTIFVFHNKKPPFSVRIVFAVLQELLTFSKISCKIIKSN